MDAWYKLSTDETLKKLGTTEAGLKESQIDSLREEYGRNALREAPSKSKLAMFLGQFKDVMII
ncbi:MAG TPA: cation-transporting P-type ATPase, partial [Cyclobacteriaceae bacterium]|nr:cation-transporting P-type ATPase [Cyclobacteriaceae bacterium]